MTATRTATLDDMIEFAMEALLSGNAQRKRAMVRRMAERWPEEPALALVYAVTAATAAIEDSFGAAAVQFLVLYIWRSDLREAGRAADEALRPAVAAAGD